MPPKRRKQLLRKQHQQRPTNRRQAEIMRHEQAIQLQRLAIPHELPAAEDDDEVDGDHDGGLAERAHGRHARGEFEGRRWVAHDARESEVEIRPWREQVVRAGEGGEFGGGEVGEGARHGVL